MKFLRCLLALLAGSVHAQQQLEDLDRGVVVMRATTTQAFVGWRLLGDDPAGTAFNVYRSVGGGPPVKINAAPLSAETHFTDSPDFSGTLTYSVRPVVGGVELPADGSFSLPAAAPVRSYFEVPLQKPGGGTSPDGTAYTYNANDASIGDLDGDGQLEIVLRWEPTNSWGGGSGGHTGPVLLDAYELDGTRLWRIDLGRNLNASAHITVFLVYDFDGDGKAELACMTADGSTDGTGQMLGNATADHRDANGVVLVGPEYLTIFDGETGAALASTLFTPQRHPATLFPTPAQIEDVWGDGYGNRVNRFLAGVAYLDGKRPSIVFSRGYYTRSVLAAWDWRGGQLTSRWVFDSDDGTPGNAAYRGQGNHNLSIADVDRDGFDEIIYGSCAIDHDGSGLYSTGLGHGDALHVSDMVPDRLGLEVFAVHEDVAGNGGIGSTLRDARTGAILWSTPASSDTGRGVAFDIDPVHPGFEAWASNSSSLFGSAGNVVATTRPSTYNFGIWWDGLRTRSLLDGTRIDRWNPATLSLNRQLTGSGVSSNNGTKATPCLSGDLFGDWREEVVWRTSDDNALRIYTTTSPTSDRFTTLLHDPQYRVALAWQNAGYNQPPHPSFFFGDDMSAPPRAPVWRSGLIWRGTALQWNAADAWSDPAGAPVAFTDGSRVLFDLTGAAATGVQIPGTPQPAEVVVHAPETVSYTLDGSLAGPMPLAKAGHGRLTLVGVHAFTGATHLQQGSLFVNGTLSHSPAVIEGRATVGGAGTFGAGLALRRHARLAPGPAPAQAGTLAVGGTLELSDATIEFDLGAASDLISVNGPLVLSGVSTLAFRFPDGPPEPGSYPLIQFSGSLTGGLANLQVAGLGGAAAGLSLNGSTISLVVTATRPPAAVSWRGTASAWDLDLSENWLLAGDPARFVSGDAVSFGDAGAAVPSIVLTTEMFPSSVSFSGTASYAISGPGAIGGSGGLTKSGTGVVVLGTANTFTGEVEITGGTVEVATLSLAGSPGPLGAGTGSIGLAGGRLRATGSFASTDRPFMLGAAAASFDVANPAGNLVLSGDLSGPAALEKTGPGRLTLSGTNGFSGGIVLHAGTVTMGSSASLGGGAITLAGGTLAMGSFAPPNAITVTADSTISGGSGGGSHGVKAISGTGTLTLNANQVFDLEGSLAGFSGRVELAGSGSFRLFGSMGSAAADFDLGSRSISPRSGTAFQFGSLAGDSGSVLGGAGGYTATVTHTVGGNGHDCTFAGTIADGTGPVHLVKTGTGTLVLSGTSTHTGSTMVSGGRLRITGTTTATTITVQSGATLGGEGTVNGDVFIQTGAALELGTAPLAVNGNLAFGVSAVLRPVAGSISTPGTYPVVTYTGTLTGTPDLAWEAPPGSTLKGNVDTSTPGVISLTLSLPPRPPGPVIWTGAFSTDWELGSNNWLSGGDAVSYQNGDSPSFLDTGSGSTINLPASVQPTLVTIDATKSYTFAGAGVITGSAALAKSGAGTLSLPGIHSYDGGSSITGGILAITQTGTGGSAIGGQAGTGTITLGQGGEFRMGSANGKNFPVNAITIQPGSSGVLSSVSLTNGYGGAIAGAADSTLTLSGPISMGGSGTAQLGGFSGTAIIPAGSQLRFSSTSGANGNGGAGATFQVDGLLNTRNAGGANGVVLGALAGGGTVRGQSNTTAGTVVFHVGAKNQPSVFTGVMANGENGTAALNKTGNANFTLAGACTYTGPTTVSSGTLVVTGSLANTTTTVASSGTLGGSGSIAGAITCHGRLNPAGTLTLSNGLVLSPSSVLDLELGTVSDRVDVTGNLTLAGTVVITAGPDFGPGIYPLIGYSGSLSGEDGLAIGSLPAGYEATIDTATAGQIRLVVTRLLTSFEQWQIDHFGSASHPDAAPDADPDRDGTGNDTEFRLGLDPKNGSSSFKAGGTLASGGFTLTWPSAAGLNFEIHRSSSLSGAWELLGTVTGMGQFTDPSPPPGNAFYRVVLLP